MKYNLAYSIPTTAPASIAANGTQQLMLGVQIIGNIKTVSGQQVVDAIGRLTSQKLIPSTDGTQLLPIGQVVVESHSSLYTDSGLNVGGPALSGDTLESNLLTLQSAIQTALTAFLGSSGVTYPTATSSNPNPKALAGAIVAIETVLAVYCDSTGK